MIEERLQDEENRPKPITEMWTAFSPEAWGLEAGTGSYYYVLDAEKVAAPTKPDDAERVERTVLGVGEGILGQDFEPRPSPAVCGWCDYRLICPAAES